ncbi:MAG: SDR family NAD(P)-dependent oxidoreductase [Candidatus Phaeomarinobacter sp.]
MSRVKGSNAVITGGADGIGAAYALALADVGVNVAVLDVLEDKARATADEVKKKGVQAAAIATDVTDRGSLASAAGAVEKALGPVSLLIVNAGVGIGGGYIGASERAVDWLLNVNVVGPINTVRAFVPGMLEQAGERHVAFTASSACLAPLDEGLAAYGASKKAMAGLAEGVRAELMPKGIGVTTIYPGLVNTRIWDAARSRPEKFGGPRHQPEEAGAYWRDEGMTVEHVAALAIDAMEAGKDHCVVPDASTREKFDYTIAALEAGFPSRD